MSLLLFSIISASQELCRDQGRELRKAFVLWETQLALPGVSFSSLFPSQKIHHRETLHHTEVRTGKYRRYFQCVQDSGVCALGSEGWMADFPLLLVVAESRPQG